MSLFAILFVKLIPLYALILLGFISGKGLRMEKTQVAKLLIYVITPYVVFEATLRAKLHVDIISLPILFFSLGTILCFLCLFIARRIWTDSTKNILAFAAGAGNTGYFGLPVIISLFGEDVISFAVFAVLGMILYENSIGYFVTARGNYSVEESIKKMLRLPSLYAFGVGITLNALQVTLPESVHILGFGFRHAYTILGMMIIGIGISGVKFSTIDVRFLSISFCMKFLAWPLVMSLIFFIDAWLFHIYSLEMKHILLILSIVPLAANTVVFAAELDTKPEQASFAVLASTFFALFYIPFCATLLKLT